VSRDLQRLSTIVGVIMRVGVTLSATALIIGLALAAAGHPFATAALKTGLILLMVIPAARLAASIGDALVRRDTLLIGATAVVAAVLLWQFFHPL
jgi:uncharacterized membrane protein